MNHKSTIFAGVVLSIIIIGMFVFAYIKKQEIASDVQSPVVSVEEQDPYRNITRIDAKHFYIDTTHTLVGEIVMPTQCDLLNWDTKVQESMPETAIIDFDVVNSTKGCAEVATPQRFKVSFDASVGARVKARFMGRDVELNLIPAGEGETPDSFELFIKG
ncbi:MAG: hypothetical protein NUW00_04230 [Candidatus Kaiserbacteria bacterium]|nr:hypothetical protein [Candidatus Kaiserbacteria bacterium]